MELGEHCTRCRRHLVGIPDGDEPVICTGCMTAAEDVDETQAVVAILEREYADLELRDPEAAQPLHAAIARVLSNLDNRRLGSLGAIAVVPSATGPATSTDAWTGGTNGRVTKP
jgi:hypothetical protein